MELLTIFCLTAHLLSMNLASAGPLMSVWLRWQEAVANDGARSLGRRLAWSSAAALIVGMLTGGLLIFTVPAEGLWNALTRFPASAYWFAAVELAFSLACMLGIAAGWQRFNKWWLVVLALTTVANLLYHFPPMMAVIGQLASNPRWTEEPIITRSVLVGLMTDGEVLALSFHFGLSSMAVAAIATLYLADHERVGGSLAAYRLPLIRRAAGLAFAATALQLPVGLWLTFSLATPARAALMGAKPAAALAFLMAIAGAFVLMQRLVLITIGATDHKSLRQAVLLICGVVLLMTTSLRLSRPSVPHPIALTKTATNQIGRRWGINADAPYSMAAGSLLASSRVPPGSFPSFIISA